MSYEHNVEQGDHIARIAAQYGFTSSAPIWDHPDNAELKTARQTPNILAPGDRVAVPLPTTKEVEVASGTKHRFQLRRGRLLLRVRVLDLAGAPVASTPCTLAIDGKSSDATTDGDGVVEAPIEADARVARLTLGDLDYELFIGFLDPVGTLSGVAARLHALGYPAGDVDEPDEAQLAFAAELFRFDQGLPVSGDLDPALGDALRDAFGC
jgi:hypothetical protein